MFTNQACLTVLLLLFTFLCFISGSIIGALMFGAGGLCSYLIARMDGNRWNEIVNKK